MANATDRQLDGILRRANKLGGTRFRYLSQVRDVIGLSGGQLQRGISGPQASAIIEELDARLAAQAEAEARAAEAARLTQPPPADTHDWPVYADGLGAEEIRMYEAAAAVLADPGQAAMTRLAEALTAFAAGLDPRDPREREQDHAEEAVADDLHHQPT